MRWVWLLWLQLGVLNGAILPPPWADPSINPCAAEPGGWLKLYWPEDGQCYRIFQKGEPCPETMELSPGTTGAECKCPPGQIHLDNGQTCYQINSQGPCERGQYLAPVGESFSDRRGKCMSTNDCTVGEVFWPKTQKCHLEYTKGPCPVGQLLVNNNDTNLAECVCDSKGPLSRYYWAPTRSCHQFYTRGPCLEKGALFLPGPKCGCHSGLPNYHVDTEQCYEIGGSGPCKPGQVFQLTSQGHPAECTCKPDHVPWLDGHCYRAYTRGPCPLEQLLDVSGNCIGLPCAKGKLYFPTENKCYRVGVKGPCPKGHLVLFEQKVRTSFEGISYRGMCGCPGLETCEEEFPETSGRSSHRESDVLSTKILPVNSHIDYKKATLCETMNGKEVCHQLYTQGPCLSGEWLVPNRQSRSKRRATKEFIPKSVGVYIGHRFNPSTVEPLQAPQLFTDNHEERRKGRCECRPGYSKVREDEGCRLPLIALAKFLNGEDYFK